MGGVNEIRTQADLDDRDSQTDEEIGQEVAPLVSPSDRHRGDVGDVVEAAVDDERRAADTETRRDVEAGRCEDSGQSRARLYQKAARDSLISHQIGALFTILLDQTIEFKPTRKLIIAIQTAKEHAPTFQDWNIFLDIDKNINRHAPKFAIGTRGKVESMLGRLRLW